VVDEYTVRLNLGRPFAPIISHLSHSFIGMLSPNQIANQPAGEPVTNPVGTGPYRFVRWDRGSQIVMSVNTDFYGDVPSIPRAIFRFIPEDAARVVALETGEVDAVMNIPPNQAERLGMNPSIRLEYPSSVRVLYAGFNTSEGPLADPRVRRALNLAVNKNAIVDSILQGTGQVSTAPIVPAVFGHTAAGPYEYNPTRARQLLAQAGYPNGFDVTFYHPTGRYPLDATVAEAVQAMLAEVGVDATLQTLEWSSYLSALRVAPDDAQQDMYMLGWGTVTLDADYGLYALLHSSQSSPAGWNVSYYGNDRVDALLSQARSNPDRAERAELYEEAIELIWDDAPWLFLHDVGTIDAYRADVTGLIHHPLENLLVWDAEFVR
jgi:peptide/nickel transport system substrate-binding protein